MKVLLRPNELVRQLGFSIPWLYKMVRLRRIPYFKVGGALRFDLDEIERWLQEQRNCGEKKVSNKGENQTCAS